MVDRSNYETIRIETVRLLAYIPLILTIFLKPLRATP
jgi:hypothetical protein